MRKLLIPLLAALALITAFKTFSKYPSSTEASQACYQFRRNRKDGSGSNCKQEYSTRQFIYIKNYYCQRRTIDAYKPKGKCGPKKVIKRFKY